MNIGLVKWIWIIFRLCAWGLNSGSDDHVDRGGLVLQLRRQYCDEESSVYVLAGASALLEDTVQQHVDTPYFIHPVTCPEPGGRLDNINIIHTWCQWRIRRQTQLNWNERYQTLKSILEPT